ncbi:variable surface lipoprotein [Metamycoplasma hominis]|uniref:variable surface lipoprotein n=1 Tax=Metamycoplasma hominis TaxID=2098 RepID=UPI0034A4AD7B
MKKSKKILLTIGIAFPLLASTPLVAAGCVETKKPEGEKPGTTPEKKPEGETTIENIINKHKEIKDDELNNTKSLLDQFKKSIEERTNQAALNEAKKQLNSALKHAAKINTGSFDFNQKFSFNKEYVKGLEAIKSNDLNAIKEITFKLNSFINLATSKKPGTTPEVKPEGETTAALNEAKKQLNSALKHAAKINTGSFDFNQKFSFNKEYVKGLEAIKSNDLNAIKEITFELNSLINLTTSQKSKTTSEIKNDVEGEVHELNDLIAKLNDFVSNYVEETFNDIDEAGLISSIDNWIDMVEGFIKESKNPSESLYFKLEYLKSQTKTFYEQKMESWANKVSDLLIEKGYDLLDKIANIKMVKNLAGYQKELEDCLNEFAELDETITVEKQFELSKKLYDLIPKIQKELDNEHNKTLNNELN